MAEGSELVKLVSDILGRLAVGEQERTRRTPPGPGAGQKMETRR
jgi:hypothetical protein